MAVRDSGRTFRFDAAIAGAVALLARPGSVFAQNSTAPDSTLVNPPLVMENENNRNFTGPSDVLTVRKTIQ